MQGGAICFKGLGLWGGEGDGPVQAARRARLWGLAP